MSKGLLSKTLFSVRAVELNESSFYSNVLEHLSDFVEEKSLSKIKF